MVHVVVVVGIAALQGGGAMCGACWTKIKSMRSTLLNFRICWIFSNKEVQESMNGMSFFLALLTMWLGNARASVQSTLLFHSDHWISFLQVSWRFRSMITWHPKLEQELQNHIESMFYVVDKACEGAMDVLHVIWSVKRSLNPEMGVLQRPWSNCFMEAGEQPGSKSNESKVQEPLLSKMSKTIAVEQISSKLE